MFSSCGVYVLRGTLFDHRYSDSHRGGVSLLVHFDPLHLHLNQDDQVATQLAQHLDKGLVEFNGKLAMVLIRLSAYQSTHT